jgi:hypothetical protein
MKERSFKVIFVYRQRIKILFWMIILSCVTVFSFVTYGYLIASHPTAYLPDIQPSRLKSFSIEPNKFQIKSPWYKLLADEKGRVTIETVDGQVIMSSLTYYMSNDLLYEDWGLKEVFVKLDNDSTISIKGEGAFGNLINILLSVHIDEPKLDVRINTFYKKDISIRRESLVATFDIPVSAVFRKNGKVDINEIESEYWLNRGGALFGKGDRSALIYHTSNVSSLQLDSKKNIMFVNLEYFLDHPYINYPLQNDGGGKWTDLSCSYYRSGSERNCQFSIYLGNITKVTPRFLLVPKGYLAGYIFTDHADGDYLQTLRAAYFGAEDISNINDARGGFTAYKIPVTKSVFYFNPIDSSTIPQSTQILDFLDQLFNTGIYDLCLHTPENLNSNRNNLDESIKFMNKRYKTTTWIDHGFYNGKINRECFVCDGLNRDSKYYAADLWEKYNTRYFWNTAEELKTEPSVHNEVIKLRFRNASVALWSHHISSKELKDMNFISALVTLVRRLLTESEMNTLQPHKGEACPTPLYWLHPTRTEHFYSWVTDYVKTYNKLSKTKVKKEYNLLCKLLNEWGIFINHGYFTRISPGKDILNKKEGKIIIDPSFDTILKIMAQMRDKGDLYITTIKELLNYWILCENVSFKYLPNGTIDVNNNNDEPIIGLSFAVHEANVLVNGNTPNFRLVGEDMIFWFNIKARGQMNLKFYQK